MTREERIEAAARALRDMVPRKHGMTEGDALIYARGCIEAAYPELMSDPPTGWVAPWEASDWMVQNGAVEIAGIDMGMYDGNWKYVRECMAEAWRAARDAHTKVVEVGDADASAG